MSYTADIPYQSGHTRALWTIGLLSATVVLSLFNIVLDFWEYLQFGSNGLPPDDEITILEVLQFCLAIPWLIVIIATVISFCMWIYRAHQNLPALGGRNLKHSPRWAVGNFFIPILNLWRPYQVMQEIANVSDPRFAISDASGWTGVSTPAVTKVWWFFWLVSNFVERASTRLYLSARTPNEYMTSDLISIAGSILTIIAAVAAIQVIRLVDERQQEKAQRLSMTNPPASTAS